MSAFGGTTAAGVVLALLAGPLGGREPAKPPAPEGVFQAVSRGDVVQTLVERGTVEAGRQADIVCRVRGGGTLKWVADEGSHVKKGDRVAELDDSAARDRLRGQEAAVAQRRAAAAQ